MRERLQAILDRFDHLTDQLSDPAVISDTQKFRSLSQERSSLERVVELSRVFLDLTKRKEGAEELIKSGGEMAELASEEIREVNRELPELEKKILIELLPKDPHEGRNTLIEIRAGAGGDEASLFAADLIRMYMKYAGKKGWSSEIISESFSEKGGYKEVVAMLSGPDVYGSLKFESGVHRVQRIPVTEASGRIHTSTVTVAIMPEATDAEVHIDEKDLKIDTMRAGGAGGQHVNKTESAVRITHLPTNTIVICRDERSQIKNRARAMQVLRTRLLDQQIEKQNSELAAQRKAQVGTGDRSERIRTYNFQQERVTDHRIGLTLKKLTSVMEGDLDEIIQSLQQDEYTRKLAESLGQPVPTRQVSNED